MVSCQLTFDSSLTVQSYTTETFEYAVKSDNSSWCVLDFNTSRIGRLITDWSVKI